MVSPDNMSDTVYLNLLQQMFDNLADKINAGKNSRDDTELLKDIRKQIEQSKSLSGEELEKILSNSNLSRDVVDAIKNASEVSNETILASSDELKTIFEQIADSESEAKKAEDARKEHQGNIEHHLHEISKNTKEMISSLGKQFATGNIQVAGFSTITNMMSNSVNYYRNMVSMGQDFGGSIINMRNAMNESGMTMKQFNDALMNGSQGLRMLGGQSLATFAGSVNSSIKALGDMGMTGDQLNEAMSDYMDSLRTSGKLNTMTAAQFNQSFRGFNFQAEQLAHELGISRREAYQKLNQTNARPDTNILLNGTSRAQADDIRTLLASVSNSPQISKMLNSALENAIHGGGPNREIGTMIGAVPALSPEYGRIVNSLRRMRVSDAQENKELTKSILATIDRMGKSVSDFSVASGYYGNASGQQGVEFAGEVQNLNANQMIRNINSNPNNRYESGGTSRFDRNLLETNHDRQAFVNHYERLTTSLIVQNKEFITETVGAYNKMLTEFGNKLESIGKDISKALGVISTPTSGISSAMGNHPWLTLGAIFGGQALLGVGALGRLYKMSRSLISVIRGGPGTRMSANTSILRTIANRLSRSNLKSAFNIPGLNRLPSLFSGLSSILRSPVTKILGKGAGILGLGLSAYDIGSDILAKPKDTSISASQEAMREHSRGYWKLGGMAAGALIGGTIGSFVGPVGTVAGASLGSSIGSAITGYGYDYFNRNSIDTNTRPNSNSIVPRNNTTPSHSNVSNQPSQHTSIHDNIRTASSDGDTLNRIEKIIRDYSNDSNSNMRQLISKIDDVNRSVKNNSSVL